VRSAKLLFEVVGEDLKLHPGILRLVARDLYCNSQTRLLERRGRLEKETIKHTPRIPSCGFQLVIIDLQNLQYLPIGNKTRLKISQ
jgi:hypothetical protein